MAGRGTDIMLGGNAEFMAVADLAARGLDPAENARRVRGRLARRRSDEGARSAVAAEHDEVVELGGLYVLGTERHESRRIDNQLRGRSGRQGDPGESRFYLSMQDDLMRLFNSSLAESMMNRAGFPDDVPARVQDRHARHRERAGSGRGAQLRDPQERPEVRRRPLASAHRHLRRAPPRARGRGHAGADPALHHRRRHGVRRPARRPRAHPEHWDLEALWTALKAVYPVSIEVGRGRRAGRGSRRV